MPEKITTKIRVFVDENGVVATASEDENAQDRMAEAGLEGAIRAICIKLRLTLPEVVEIEVPDIEFGDTAGVEHVP
jgi:hypothetical protein